MTSNRCIAGLLMVVLAAAALVTPARIAAATATVSGVGSQPCRTVVAPALVYALRGSVYRVNPDGHNLCRLTPPVNAKEPRLAPNGKSVAFLSGVGSDGSGYGAVNVVRVAQVRSTPSSGTIVSSRGSFHAYVSWSPDSRRLAFLDGSNVRAWNTVCRCTRLLVPGTRSMANQSFVWSRDSRRLAVALVSSSLPPSTRLLLSIADAATAKRHVVVIRFPGWLRGNGPYQESYPSQIIAWLPHGKLLIGTSGIGVGLRLTGLWVASPRDGMAHMILGTRASPRVILRFPLLNSTQALVSPNGRKLLLNPGNRLWIAPSSGRNAVRVLTTGIHGSCAVSQIVWVGNPRLAYVVVCSVGAMSARLYLQPAGGGKPRLLASVRSPLQDQEALSIAPPTRCIACG